MLRPLTRTTRHGSRPPDCDLPNASHSQLATCHHTCLSTPSLSPLIAKSHFEDLGVSYYGSWKTSASRVSFDVVGLASQHPNSMSTPSLSPLFATSHFADLGVPLPLNPIRIINIHFDPWGWGGTHSKMNFSEVTSRKLSALAEFGEHLLRNFLQRLEDSNSVNGD